MKDSTRIKREIRSYEKQYRGIKSITTKYGFWKIIKSLILRFIVADILSTVLLAIIPNVYFIIHDETSEELVSRARNLSPIVAVVIFILLVIGLVRKIRKFNLRKEYALTSILDDIINEYKTLKRELYDAQVVERKEREAERARWRAEAIAREEERKEDAYYEAKQIFEAIKYNRLNDYDLNNFKEKYGRSPCAFVNCKYIIKGLLRGMIFVLVQEVLNVP